jgi:metal-responsive CopG/Arc/MetJ family transcriptional regulator
MSKSDAERVITPLPRSLLEAIEDYRYGTRVPSRSEAIRRLIAAGLEAERQRAAHSVPKPRRGAKPTT